MTTDSTELERVLQAIRKAWDDGCPVAGPPWEQLARVAVRRWDTFSNRGIQHGDVEARIRDLMKGLIADREADPSLVGPLKTDYDYLARVIGVALSPERQSALKSLAAAVAELPRGFRHGNRSAAALLAASGYLEKPEELTRTDLMAYLELNPDLVSEWRQYSRDKRTTSGWFISKASDVWILAFFPDGARHTFSSELEACAAFIELEVADIAKAAG